MTLRDAIADDARLVFCNEDDFAESAVYVPYTYPGDTLRTNRTISAVIIRNGYQVLPEDGDTITLSHEVHVANDATYGITGDELIEGRDRLRFPAKDGADEVTFTILRITGQDHGMLTLECR